MKSWDEIEQLRDIQTNVEKKKSETTLIRECLNRIAVTEDGKFLFKFFAKLMMHKESTITYKKDGTIDLELTAMNESRRSLWLQIREFLTVDNRNEIERD